jgi:hypothetical protein
MVAQIATTTTEIISSYTSTFDGITIDTIKMVHPDGTIEIRYGWTELTNDGQTIHFIRTKDGTVLNGKWATVRSNKWMTAYKALRPVTTQPRPRPVVIPVIPMIRSYAGKAFSAGRIKSNPDMDITQEQMDKILRDARQSLG